MGTCVVLYGRLWQEALVGCGCAFRMADCPTVGSMVHFQSERLLYFVVKIAVVPEVFVDCFATDVV